MMFSWFSIALKCSPLSTFSTFCPNVPKTSISFLDKSMSIHVAIIRNSSHVNHIKIPINSHVTCEFVVHCTTSRTKYSLFRLNLQHAHHRLTSDSRLPQATMETATLQTSSSLFLPPDSYIYKLLCANTGALIAAISSDDSLRVFDLGTLAKQSTAVVGPDNALKDVHTGVTCLEAFGAQQEHCVLTAGRDGAVRGWDLRSGKRILELKDRKDSQLIESWQMGVIE